MFFRTFDYEQMEVRLKGKGLKMKVFLGRNEVVLTPKMSQKGAFLLKKGKSWVEIRD